MTCEDFPCCGHEAGDCEGQKYGSDESIKARVEEQWRTGHGYCEHEAGIYNCESDGDDEECEDEDHECVDCDQTDTGWECLWCNRPCPEDAHLEPRCPACGDLADYCLGHGTLGDPAGARILAAHDDGDHSACHAKSECKAVRV